MNVATFNTTYLGYTETFIYSQLTRLRHVRRRSFALETRHLDRFPLDELYTRPRGLLGRFPKGLERPVAPWLLWALYRHETDVIHAHFGTAGRRILPYAKLLRVPLVVSYYGFDVGILLEPGRHPEHRWYSGSIDKLFRGAALHLALTEEMRGLLAKLGAPRERIKVHYNGVDLSRFRVREQEERPGLRVFLCGREVEKKGFSYGLRALQQASRTCPEISIELLGTNGPLRPSLEALAGELGLGERLRFIDDSDGLPAIMARQDVILAPSVTAQNGDREGLPTVLVEAAACGVPAIASRHAGIPEIVRHEETGLLCEERDVEALARAIVVLARDAPLRRRLGAAARRLAEQEFDIDRLSERLEGYYRELASDR